jgi:solute carrier family 25 (mitochondrial citrate transporter), member 1
MLLCILACLHVVGPLDTIRVRMQLSRSGQGATAPPGTTGTRAKARRIIATGVHVVRRETPLLQRARSRVIRIVTKMATRFASFETYKGWMADRDGKTGVGRFLLVGSCLIQIQGEANDYWRTDGLGTGVTATGGRYAHGRRQQQSLADPLNAPPGRYRNAGHVVYAIVKEEGVAALHRSVTLIALRQATNRGECCVSRPEGSWFFNLTARNWKRHPRTGISTIISLYNY